MSFQIYHLNVYAGDSTLILYQNPPTPGCQREGVLIDGGRNGAWSASVVTSLADIYAKLVQTDQNNVAIGAPGYRAFKLSAIVVTHNDADHIDGIYSLLKGLRREVRGLFPNVGNPPAAAAPFGSLAWYFYNYDLDGRRTRYYSPGARENLQTGNMLVDYNIRRNNSPPPQGQAYQPDNINAMFFEIRAYVWRMPVRAGQFNLDTLAGQNVHDGSLGIISQNPPQPNYVRPNADNNSDANRGDWYLAKEILFSTQDIDPGYEPIPNPPPNNQPVRYGGFYYPANPGNIVPRITTSSVNSGSGGVVLNGIYTTSFQNLIQAILANAPTGGLYCIAVNGKSIEPTPPAPPGPSFEYGPAAITLGGPQPQSFRGRLALTPNNRSIVLILIDQHGYLVYYTGGDIGGIIETRIAGCLRQLLNQVPIQNQNIIANPITAVVATVQPAQRQPLSQPIYMKFSHHGSAYSTPPYLIDVLQPTAGFFSSGHAHNHPTWQLIYYCYYWKLEALSQLRSMSLLSNSYPYYLRVSRRGQPPPVHNRDTGTYIAAVEARGTYLTNEVLNFPANQQQQLNNLLAEKQRSRRMEIGPQAPGTPAPVVGARTTFNQLELRWNSIGYPNKWNYAANLGFRPIGPATVNAPYDSGTAYVVVNIRTMMNPSAQAIGQVQRSTGAGWRMIPTTGNYGLNSMALTLKRRLKNLKAASVSLTLLASSYGSITDGLTNYIYLSPGCDLDLFISALPLQMLILDQWVATGDGITTWGGSGTLDGGLYTWLQGFGLSTVRIEIQTTTLITLQTQLRNSDNTQRFPMVSSPQVLISGIIVIGSDQMNLTGSIQQSNSLDTTVGTEWTLIMSFAAGSQINLLNLLLESSFANAGAVMLDALGVDPLNVDVPNSTLTLYAQKDCVLSLDLVLSLGDLPSNLTDQIVLQSGTLQFGWQRRYLCPNEANDTMVMTASVTAQIGSVSCDASIQFNSLNSFIISLQITNTNDALSTVAALLPTGTYTDQPFSIIDSDYNSQNLQLSGGVSVELSVSSTDVEIVSVVLNGSLSLHVCQNLTLDLALQMSFPGTHIYGVVTTTNTLQDIIPGCSQIMSGNPNSTSTQFSFYTNASGDYEITAIVDSSSKPIPIIGPLSLDQISVVLTTTNVGGTSSTSFKIEAGLTLEDPSDPTLGSADLEFIGSYDQGEWVINATVSDLSSLSLLTMIGASRDDLRAIIPDLHFVDVQCQANLSIGAFLFGASTLIGSALFDFLYQYVPANTSNGSTEISQIKLSLSSAKGNVNLGSILSTLGISGVPAFFNQINLPFAKIEIQYDLNTSILTLATLNEDRSFVIVFYRYLSEDDQTPLYFARVVMSGISGFPVVGKVGFPLDSFYLTWVSSLGGLDSEQLSEFASYDPDMASYSAISSYLGPPNTTFLTGSQAFIVYQAGGTIQELSWGSDSLSGESKSKTSKDFEVSKGSKASKDFEILKGLKTAQKPEVSKVSMVLKDTLMMSKNLKQGSVSGVLWVDINKGFGPVYFNRIGINLNPALTLYLDAALTVGPLKIQLEGLGVNFDLSSDQPWYPNFSLAGLGINYSTPGFKMAGSLLQVVDPPAPYLDRYDGGLVVTLGSYVITVMGSYGRIANPNGEDDITFFVFGRLIRPLGGPPIAYVTGLSAGFGYNQFLTIPEIDKVSTFPLVQGAIASRLTPPAMVSGTDPLEILKVLMNQGPDPKTRWITPQIGNKWLALGIDISSYELISTRALLAFNFGADLEISLVGLSNLSLPKTGPTKIVFVEMALKAQLIPSKGTFQVIAILTPNSFVLDPRCKLTGGFAVYVWFSPSQYAGDFVVTAGGYHPSFVIPAHYPKVNKLGFSWKYNDNISITGGAYFAITPSCAMAGGGLDFNYHSGCVRAWYNAQANFIVYWNPLSFTATIGIRMGASAEIDILWWTQTFTVELNAQLALWGPPIGGQVDFSIKGYGFRVRFGDPPPLPALLSWSQFIQTLPQVPNTSQCQFIKISPQAGLSTQVTGPDPPDTWLVWADTFQFRIDFTVPITYVIFNTDQVVCGQPSFNIRLMGAQNYTSTCIISVTDSGGDPVIGWQPVALNSWSILSPRSSPLNFNTGGSTYFYPSSAVNNNTNPPSPPSNIGLLQQNVAAGVWGVPLNSGGNASSSDSAKALTQDRNSQTISHYTGMVLSVPPANINNSSLSSPIDLSIFMDGSSYTVDVPSGDFPSIELPTIPSPDTAIMVMHDALQDINVSERRRRITQILSQCGFGTFNQQSPWMRGKDGAVMDNINLLFPNAPVLLDPVSMATTTSVVTITDPSDPTTDTTVIVTPEPIFTVHRTIITQGQSVIFEFMLSDYAVFPCTYSYWIDEDCVVSETIYNNSSIPIIVNVPIAHGRQLHTLVVTDATYRESDYSYYIY